MKTEINPPNVQPLLISAQPEQDIIVMVDNQVVVYLKADKVRIGKKLELGIMDTPQYLDYNKYGYCGISVTTEDEIGSTAFISSCSATLAVTVPEASPFEVIKAVIARGN